MRLWWLQLGRYARPHGRGLLLIILLMLLSVAFDTLRPWPMKLLVDYALSKQPLPNTIIRIISLFSGASPPSLVGWLAASTVVLFLAGQAIRITHGYVQAGIGSRMVYDLGAQLFNHLQRLSLRFHGRQSIGDLVRRVMTDSGCTRDLMTGVFLPVLTSLASLATMFIVMWRLDHFLSLLALVAAIPLGVLIRVFARPMAERTYKQQELQGEMMALAEQTLTALPIVQAFGRENHEDGRFRSLSQRTVQAYLSVIFSQLQCKVGTTAVTAIGTAAVTVIGGLHVLQGSLSVGSLLVFLSYLISLYAPLETFAYISSEFASASACARRVLEVLDVEDEVRDTPEAKPLPLRPTGERGHMRFENVTFGYEPGCPVIEDINIEAFPGQSVALVGSTGAGKSTLVSLIPRFFDPWRGRVTLDGMDLRGIVLENLRAQVSLVLQEPFLLPLTVAENIAYGRPGASHEEIVLCAVAANADEFIRRLPRGYDTVIGERGATLSGGEKQRLAIARALLKDAPILILDEPTSALDAQTESLLLEALERLMKGRTTFIIAHRLSTVRKADRIVVIDRGKVVEMGTQRELLAASDVYKRLHALQFGPTLVTRY
jgi:ABC-type multidrug transport system fused ATPase/permease subunit